MSDVAPNGDVLVVEGLTGPAGAVVVHDVSLTVPHGRTIVVLGEIHSGKTMVLRHLLGLEHAEHGRLTVDGEVFDARGESDARLRRMRTRIGTVFEGSALISRISVIENVELPLLEHTDATSKEARETARELLGDVGLRGADEATPQDLDRGAQRRVAFARALALRPPLLVLDEPTLGLDSHSAAQFDDMVGRLQDRHGFGTLIFSHEVRHAYGRAHRIYIMSKGHVVAHGTRQELMEDPHAAVGRLLNRRARR